jgi:replicative DNA helicase
MGKERESPRVQTSGDPSGIGKERPWKTLYRRLLAHATMTAEQILSTLYAWLGNKAILLPIPLGEKDPGGTGWKAWQKTTFEQTQATEYQARLLAAAARGGNIGVLLTDGLVSIDADGDQQVADFLALNAELDGGTLQSRGARGRNIWLQLTGDYPHDQAYYCLKTASGEKWGEFRCNRCQTIVFGQHPNTTAGNVIRYCCVVREPVMEGTFGAIAWPPDLVLPWLKKKPIPAAPKTEANTVMTDSRKDRRVLSYLAAIPGAVDGNGGDHQTYKVACSLVHGFDLSGDDAWSYLLSYNEKCEPPWLEKELRHKLDRALAETKHEKPRGHLLDPGYTCRIIHKRNSTNSTAQTCSTKPMTKDTDTYYEISLDTPVYDVESDEDETTFPLEAFPVVIQTPAREIVRHYKVTPALAANVALSINSAAIGRGITVQSNVRKTYANLYMLIGAQSGTGKSVVYEDLSRVIIDEQNSLLEDYKAKSRPELEAELKLLDRDIQALLKEKDKDDLGTRQLRLSDFLKEQSELTDRLEGGYRLVSSDFTSEGLGKLLVTSGEQMAVLSDEGGLCLYNMMGRYTKGDMTDDIFLSMCKTVTPHIVDRVSRAPIILKHPCVTLMLMLQPDLINKAFADERLRVGGFLCRCLFFDSRLKIQYEDEHSLPPPDRAVMEAWSTHIQNLLQAYRMAEQSFTVEVGSGVRQISRLFRNEIVDKIRDDLGDVASFAIRWAERAWEIALNFHVAIHGAEAFKHVLSAETFKNAIALVRWFMIEELRVLQVSRLEATNKTAEKLEELFRKNNNSPISLRDLDRRHRIAKSDVVSCVKSNEHLFVLATRRSARGGVESRVVFPRAHPPDGWKPTKKGVKNEST